MTHLLPAGRVPRVHGAWSPVPPRLPHFATPRSVRCLAAVAAGAYPPRRHPDAWSPGAPALPGPCYWLVASGTPVGWRGRCLAFGLVRGAVRHYCLGGCSALVVWAQRSRPVRGGWGRCLVLCLPRLPLPAPRSLRCVWRAVSSGCCLSSLAGTPFHAVCAFCGLGQVALFVFPRVSSVCVCARALARSRCRALVRPFHGVRAPPRVLPRSCALFGVLGGGGRPGPVSPYLAWGCALPVGWMRAWGPVTNPTAHALASCLCALWERHEGARGGRLSPLCGASGDGRSPTPNHSSFRACGRGPLPTGCGCGGAGAWGPVTNLTARALASWLCALSMRHEGARGGAPLAWATLIGRSPIPDHSSFRAYGRGPLPTGCGCGGCGRGDPSPTLQRALLRAGLARCAGSMRMPEGGASCLGVGRPGSGALPAPTTRPFGRVAGAHYPLAVGAGGAGAGPVTNPTGRALASWLCALGWWHEGAWGGHLLPGCGASGVRRSPNPDHSSLRACNWGPLSGGCGHGDLSPTPQRALLRAGLARCGGGMRVRGGGTTCLGVRRPGSGAHPPPTTRPFGRATGAH